jgi:hypothetical protein
MFEAMRMVLVKKKELERSLNEIKKFVGNIKALILLVIK